ncbi:MAG TPA: dihydrodipicolinate synthase family protein [Cyclobacteriaceae bacterium]
MTDILEKVKGPVIPLPVPFTENYEVDHISLANYVDYLCHNGIRNIMTTIGTSRFNLLSWEECMKVNEIVVSTAKGRANTIVANPTTGGIQIAKEFAAHSKSIDADFYLLYFPERHYGEENTFSFFEEVAEYADINILIHEMPMRNGLGPGQVQYSIGLLKRLMKINNICGLKEEALDVEYSNEVVKHLSKHSIIIGAGGGMSRFLNRDFELGARAFLGGIGNFAPYVELNFYNHIISNRKDEAIKIVKEIEAQYFQKVVPIGWHPSLKAALALTKHMKGTERKPMKKVEGQELEVIKCLLKDNGWL